MNGLRLPPSKSSCRRCLRKQRACEREACSRRVFCFPAALGIVPLARRFQTGLCDLRSGSGPRCCWLQCTGCCASSDALLCTSSARFGLKQGLEGSVISGEVGMGWGHSHFDGYELLAIPCDSPASIIILDSSALVVVQKVLLCSGDSPPETITWQPAGSKTGCGSGAFACVILNAGNHDCGRTAYEKRYLYHGMSEALCSCASQLVGLLVLGL